MSALGMLQYSGHAGDGWPLWAGSDYQHEKPELQEGIGPAIWCAHKCVTAIGTSVKDGGSAYALLTLHNQTSLFMSHGPRSLFSD